MAGRNELIVFLLFLTRPVLGMEDFAALEESDQIRGFVRPPLIPDSELNNLVVLQSEDTNFGILLLAQQAERSRDGSISVDSPGLYSDEFYQGDIVLYPGVGDESDPFRQRNAIRDLGKRWPNGVVPYGLTNQFSARQKAMIAAAFEDFERHTCIRFVPRRNEKAYLLISKQFGCWSTVGRSGGRQDLSLGDDCFIHGVILHELMHAVGFWHEQIKTDRDDYVNVKFENMARRSRVQFQKLDQDEIQHLGEAYDYNSVMHYGPTAFSINGLPTMVPKLSGVSIGQRWGFSDADVRKINKLYNCSSKDASNLPETDEDLGDVFIRKGSQLFGDYNRLTASSGEECFNKHCRESSICMASMTSDAVNTCWLYGQGAKVERVAEDTKGFTVFYKGKEKNVENAKQKRAFNAYTQASVIYPLDCRYECWKQRNQCGAASYTTWPLEIGGGWSGTYQCWLSRYDVSAFGYKSKPYCKDLVELHSQAPISLQRDHFMQLTFVHKQNFGNVFAHTLVGKHSLAFY